MGLCEFLVEGLGDLLDHVVFIQVVNFWLFATQVVSFWVVVIQLVRAWVMFGS